MKLTYVQDPLCGWCYAIDTALRFAVAGLEGEAQVDVLNVGLFMEGNMKPMPAFREHLHRGSKMVEGLSDARFSDDFFRKLVADDDYVYESATVGLALHALKETFQKPVLPLITEVQKRFFVGGESMSRLETFVSMAAKAGVDSLSFAKAFFDPQTRAGLEAERRRARAVLEAVQVKSVPVLVLETASGWRKIDHENHREPERLLEAIRGVARTHA